MKLKLGLIALFLSVSVLLLQSNSFSTAEIRNDLGMSVVEENLGLIAITGWEGRKFTVVNNTETNVWIESITISGDSSLGVTGTSFSLMASEYGEFILIGKSKKLWGKKVSITAKWESGRADISSRIPKFEVDDVKECTDQSIVNEEIVNQGDLIEGANLQETDEEDLIDDINLQGIDGEKVNECIEQQEADEESEEVDEEVEEGDEKANGDANEVVEEIDGDTEADEIVEETVDEEPAAAELVTPDPTEEDAIEEAVIIKGKLPEADQTEEADEQ